MLTELEAWKYIAANLKQNDDDTFSIEIFDDEDDKYTGLCPIIEDLYHNDDIDENTKEIMKNKIPPQLIKIDGSSFSFEKGMAKPRIEFCLKMCEELEKK